MNEKQATLILLEHLAEVDHRRLYAVMGYSSLWIYVHQALHYSEPQTSERVNAMRLMVKVPEVKKELEAGNLTLTTIAKLASHVKREKCKTPETLELLEAVSGKTTRETERILVSESSSEARPDLVKPVSRALTRIIIEVDQDFLTLMKRVQEVSGHPGSQPQELFRTTLQEFVKKREVKLNQKSVMRKKPETMLETKQNSKSKQKETNAPILSAHEVQAENIKSKNDSNQTEGLTTKSSESTTENSKPILEKSPSRYIPKEVKTRIRIRAGDQCEFVDLKTNKRCDCKMKLEYDHIQPFSKNGASTFENLRLLCFRHNQLAAIQEFGREKIEGYFKN